MGTCLNNTHFEKDDEDEEEKDFIFYLFFGYYVYNFLIKKWIISEY